MESNLDSIIRLTKEQFNPSCEVLGRAFQDYPTSILMFPDEIERKKKIKFGFEMILKYGIRHGEAYATSLNLEAIAVMLPPARVHQSIWSILGCGGFRIMRKSGLKAIKRGMPFHEYIGPAHKRLAPFDHYYLQTIGVDPDEQGKGYGGTLLRAMMTKTDREKLPVYLETNVEKNVSFYQNYGFEVVEHTIVPKTDLPIWCMLRNTF